MLGKRISGNQFFKIFWGRARGFGAFGASRQPGSAGPPLRGLEPSLVGKACPCPPSWFHPVRIGLSKVRWDEKGHFTTLDDHTQVVLLRACHEWQSGFIGKLLEHLWDMNQSATGSLLCESRRNHETLLWSRVCAVAQYAVLELRSQWERPIFAPSPLHNPSTNFDFMSNILLRPPASWCAKFGWNRLGRYGKARCVKSTFWVDFLLIHVKKT